MFEGWKVKLENPSDETRRDDAARDEKVRAQRGSCGSLFVRKKEESSTRTKQPRSLPHGEWRAGVGSIENACPRADPGCGSGPRQSGCQGTQSVSGCPGTNKVEERTRRRHCKMGFLKHDPITRIQLDRSTTEKLQKKDLFIQPVPMTDRRLRFVAIGDGGAHMT